ncbi:LysR substrate-binding domain-containing protein [Kiloniella antarctica]|uniref:LysR substrate-binding domain-containing protein n=1 Tax=Kiloniella antarctica TaxID=1550907 RepID=A0ABW5BIB1_9PROT
MKLPPLTAVRHFTAAATHMSFKRAAKELHVTEGAISRQIKVLEEYIGSALFMRVHRGVQLTDAGQRLHAVTDNALLQISQIAEELRGVVPQFTLSVTTSFAIRWLMPRLSHYEALHPNHPVNLQAVSYPELSPVKRFDASIIYLLGDPYENQVRVPEGAERFMVEWLLPVCAPNFLKYGAAFRPQDLEHKRIIFNEPTGRDWRSWAGKLDDAKINLDTALRFEHDDTAIQAAVAGHGIALANLAYIHNELDMGSLIPAVACDPLPIGAHYLVSEPGRAVLPHVKAFRDWLIKSAAECGSQR